ncbi:hypothetical protein EDS67_09075 [candidate division KSB1 bacterium]|nr:MAG: hypothetical protein EDS67_09075 [candidate division KSB1 bacterium]MBC6946397.1 hypothetical protein [candidate division KSB1 bacterium]MCE7941485.1 hypothetical protein [Chlorobi bacterium CHB1]
MGLAEVHNELLFLYQKREHFLVLHYHQFQVFYDYHQKLCHKAESLFRFVDQPTIQCNRYNYLAQSR